MRRLAFISFVVCSTIIPLPVWAQSYYSDGNTGNAVVLRDPARQSSTDIDAALFNPAGTAWMDDGFHISVSGMASWSPKDVSYLDIGKSYEMKNRNITPGIQLAYKKGKWAFSASFTSEGGYGKLKSKSGNAIGDAFWGQVSDLFVEVFDLMKTEYRVGYELDLIPELDIASDDEFRLNIHDCNSWLNNWTTRLGAAYKINDWLSAYVGLKFNCVHYSFNQRLYAEIYRPSTNTSFNPIAYYNDAVNRLGPTDSDNMLTSTLRESLNGLITTGELFDDMAEQNNEPISSRDWGMSPVIGVDVNLDRWNFGLKYEFESIMLSRKNDRFTSFKNPAMLSVGASWQAFNWMKAAVGSNIYFNNSETGISTLANKTTYSLSGSLTFNLPKNWILSGGYTYSNALEMTETYMYTALATLKPSRTDHISLGLGYNLNDNMQLNLGMSYYFPQNSYYDIRISGFEDSLGEIPVQAKYEEDRRFSVGIGLNYHF